MELCSQKGVDGESSTSSFSSIISGEFAFALLLLLLLLVLALGFCGSVGFALMVGEWLLFFAYERRE